MKEVLVLRDLECIKAIAHPKRIDILKAFKATPLSAKQLSQLLDEPHAKINYHIKTLYKVGVLDLVQEKVKSGIVEKYYYPRAKHIVIGKKALNFSDDTDNMDIGDICISKFENMSNSFYKAIEENAIDDENIANYSQVALSKDEIKELVKTMDLKIKDIISNRKHEDSERKYDLSLVTIPLEEKCRA
ncbi:ArsR/SmtB family transcription factor [Paraclostridium sordellii]|uniref:ArsR/SmtB family transcription factor n=1 Tax=Paraclostridium sordellii TaxID=1505 RepID=UPI0005DE09F5|nr:helix-turn-helix domain-containing protein [Paeniclostridium sordellii]MDU6114792.1 helix-turn-helix domain-containing protein [Paeniclostridium sordellii]CEN97276.1 ArsR family transcriptional regulator [[Clostridium] sordellii] [Paeniclostridium sordellii]CEN98032.1 ArsR family transcriptional regulator [[Clostridium] sordellii] [Paeniclostridium sordellii]